MTTVALDPGPLRDAMTLIAKRPGLPPRYMALMLRQDPDELLARLEAAAHVAGWLTEEPACCGRGSRFAITPAGRAAIG